LVSSTATIFKDFPRGQVIPIRVLIVDDHEIVRMGVRILLADKTQWDICGEAQNGAEAIEKVVDLVPDVVILDLTMPAMGGFDTAKRIRHIAPVTRIIFFSIHETPTTARLVGADAFVSKSSAAQDLTQAIRQVLARGGVPQPPFLQSPD
jgi:two-component system, NarL family, invasion response regulator UvrY